MVHKTPPAGFSQKKLVYGPYSPSRLITAKCPSRFFGQYVRKDSVVGHSLAAARGSAIHDVLEKITYAKTAGTILSSHQLTEWVSDAVGKYPAAYQQIDLVKAAAEAYVGNPSPYANKNTFCEKALAIQLWEEDSFVDDAIPNRVFVEAEYTKNGGDLNRDFFFGGHIDQLSIDEEIKVITILDHKSTPTSNVNEDHTFQVGAYAWLVSLFYPGYTYRTVIHYAHPRVNFYGPPVYWSPEDLSEIQSHIMSMVWSLEKMVEFPAIPGSGCDYCHMIQECPLYSKVREQKAKGALDLSARTFEDLVRLAKELHVVDAMSGEITKALKEGINTLCPNNGVNIGGLWYGYKASEEGVDWEATETKISEESERAKIRCEEGNFTSEEDRVWCEKISLYKGLDSLLVGHGVQPNNFKKYNGQKMKNLWKLDKEELFNMLRRLVVKDKSMRFGAHK